MQAARYGVFVFDDIVLQDETASRDSALVFFHPARASPQVRSVLVSLAAAIHQFAAAATDSAPAVGPVHAGPGSAGRSQRARVLALTSLKLAFQPLPPCNSLVLVVTAAERDPDEAVLEMLWRVFKGLVFFNTEQSFALDTDIEPAALTSDKARSTLQSHLRPLLGWYSRAGMAGSRGYVGSALPTLPPGAVGPKLVIQSCQLLREYSRVLEAPCAVLLWHGRILATTMPHDLAMLVASVTASWEVGRRLASNGEKGMGPQGDGLRSREECGGDCDDIEVETASWSVVFSASDLPPAFRTSISKRGSTRASLPAVPLPLIRQTSTASECTLTSDSQLIVIRAPGVHDALAVPTSDQGLAGLVAGIIMPSTKLHMTFCGDGAAAEARAAASLKSFVLRSRDDLDKIPSAGGLGAGGSPQRAATRAKGTPGTPTRLSRQRGEGLDSHHPSRHRSTSFNAVSYMLSESIRSTKDTFTRRPVGRRRESYSHSGARMLTTPEGGILASDSPRSDGQAPTRTASSPAEVHVHNGRRYRFATWCETTQTFSVRMDHPATTGDPAVAAFARHICTSRDVFSRSPSVTQVSKQKGQFTYFARQAVGQNIFAQILNPPPPSTEQFVREALSINHGIHFL